MRLPVVLVGAGTPMFRVHRDAFGPVHLAPRDPPLHRFDDPLSKFGTIYAAEHLEAAFVETLLRNPRLRLVARTEVDLRRWSVLACSRDLRVVDLTGRGLSTIGTHGGVNTGSYHVSRAWARALHEHADRPDGIVYRSRHDPSLRCWAIFARPDIAFDVQLTAAFDAAWVAATLRRYGKALSP